MMNKPKILIPIHPQWCEKIFNGEKTIEVRKTVPKIEPPFEVFVYETLGKRTSCRQCVLFPMCALRSQFGCYEGTGEVVGSFMCDKVDEYSFSNLEARYRINDVDLVKTCLNHPELIAYGKGKTLAGWHITEPKLFDEPKELSEFGTICKKDGSYDECHNCPYLRVSEEYYDTDIWCGVGNIKPLTRAPQSWIYVETV